MSKYPNTRLSIARRALSFGGTTLLAAGAFVAAGATPASAADATFNPFAVNNGFTIVSQGDAYLNNGELEGAIAAFGSLSTGQQNGYPLIHNAAGQSDYTVPTVDGVPVRALAASFTGSGAFDVSNRDDSGLITPDSAEANAVVKLVTTDGLTGSSRGGGTGNAAGNDFLRVTNSDNGLIDLKTVRFGSAEVSDFQTVQSSVEAYFGDVDGQIAETNRCLATMYSPVEGLSNPVTVSNDGGLVFVEGFSTEQPNVLNYDDIVGKTIKMDRADGYRPTTAAPIVIRVPAGTTSLERVNFEGWSSSAGADQSLARYIMFDLSEVTGPVSIDGLEMGAIWAPDATLNFNTGVTTNGQWFAGNVTTAGGGELHHHAFQGELRCGENPETPTEPTEPTEPNEPNEPTEPTEPNEPNEPTEPTEPNEPTEPTEPTEPSDETPADVEQAPENETTVADGELPRTGADIADAGWALLAGAIMLLGGIGAVTHTRRKRTE